MIKFLNLTKKYYETVIFDDFNFNVEQSEIVFFSGIYSGSLLRMIYGLDNNYSGDIFLFEKNIRASRRQDIYRDVGYISFEIPYLEERSVYYNLYLPYILHNSSAKEFKDRIYELIYDTHLFGKLDKKIVELNYQEKSIFKFIRGLVNFPRIVLIENFYVSEIDDFIVKNLKKLQSMGITVLYSLNNPHNIEYFKDFEFKHIHLKQN